MYNIVFTYGPNDSITEWFAIQEKRDMLLIMHAHISGVISLQGSLLDPFEEVATC